MKDDKKKKSSVDAAQNNNVNNLIKCRWRHNGLMNVEFIERLTRN
jgi:hypothetical protein